MQYSWVYLTWDEPIYMKLYYVSLVDHIATGWLWGKKHLTQTNPNPKGCGEK